MIEILLVLILNNALHDFGLIPGIDYDPIECIYYATLSKE